jgi:hypothetical protein
MVGSLDSKPKPATPPPAAEKKEVVKPTAEAGTGSVQPGPGAVSAIDEDAVPLDVYGDLVPYADPNWYQSVWRAPSAVRYYKLTELVPLAILQPIPRRSSR